MQRRLLARIALVTLAVLGPACSGDDSSPSGSHETSVGGSGGSSNGGSAGEQTGGTSASSTSASGTGGSGGGSTSTSSGGSSAGSVSGGAGGTASNTGGSSTSGGGAPDLPLDVAEFCDAMVERMCEWVTQCRGFTECDGIGPVGGIQSECSGNLAERLASGELEFDADRAEACLASPVVCAGSPWQWAQQSGCQGVISVPSGIGDDCYPESGFITTPCSEGYCDYSDECPGTCRDFADTGESCSDSQCAPDHACLDEECRKLPDEGESCEASCLFSMPCLEVDNEKICIAPGIEGDDCEPDSQPCDYGLVCLDGECARTVEADDPCTQNSQCPSGYGCFASTASVAASCQLWLEAGAACPNGGCDPNEGLTCQDITPDDDDDNRECVAYAGVDEPCAPVGCAQNLWCYYPEPDNPDAGVCRPRGGPGDACESETGPFTGYELPCGTSTAEYYCVQGECAAPGTIGDPCDPIDERTCAEGWCSATTEECTEPAEEDAPCNPYDAYNTCAAGLYCSCTDVDCWSEPPADRGKCIPKKPNDALCEGSEQCESDYCNWIEEEQASRCEPLPMTCSAPD